MSKLKFANPDLYMKQDVPKPFETPTEHLLSFSSNAEMLVDLEHHVFMETHGLNHAVWQITETDFGGPTVPNVMAAADQILAGNFPSTSYLHGRIFTFEAKKITRAVKRDLIRILIRGRWPYEVAGKCWREGLITAREWQRELDAFDAEIEANENEARAREAAEPSLIVQVARDLKLNPTSCGSGPDHWQASCPGTNHPLFISPSNEQWGCGWCRRKGGPDELREFHAERMHKKAS